MTKSSSISNVTHNFAVVPFYDVNKLFLFDSGWEKDVIAYEEEIIAFGHVHMTCFGHVFYDLFTPLMLLPAEIFNRAKLIITNDAKYIQEVLDMLGKPRGTVLFSHGKIVFGHVVYILSPASHINMFGWPLIKLRNKLMKKANVSESPLLSTFYSTEEDQ